MRSVAFASCSGTVFVWAAYRTKCVYKNRTVCIGNVCPPSTPWRTTIHAIFFFFRVNSTSLVIGKPYVIKVCRDGMSGCSETRKHHQPILKTQHQNWTRLITECCPGYVENDHKTGCVCSESCADEITSILQALKKKKTLS